MDKDFSRRRIKEIEEEIEKLEIQKVDTKREFENDIEVTNRNKKRIQENIDKLNSTKAYYVKALSSLED
jgi:hypothetical protein